jgi:hypothetical protein
VAPQKQKTWVRIPPGCQVFRENISMLLCVIDLCIVCVLKRAMKALDLKLFIKKMFFGLFRKNNLFKKCVFDLFRNFCQNFFIRTCATFFFSGCIFKFHLQKGKSRSRSKLLALHFALISHNQGPILQISATTVPFTSCRIVTARK